MHPLSDKDLDRLSREAAEQFDVEQNTSGWEKLEQKLNKHLPEKGKRERRRFLFFIWLFALLSGGGLLWILSGSDSSALITLKEGSSKPQKSAFTEEPAAKASEAEGLTDRSAGDKSSKNLSAPESKTKKRYPRGRYQNWGSILPSPGWRCR